MRAKRLMWLVVTLALVLEVAPWPAGAQAGAAWTFMVYLAGDNDLEINALEDFDEMERVGSTEDVNIVVQFDRAVGFDASAGDWTDARRYLVRQDANRGTIGNQPVQTLGEVNMGSEEALADFLTWAVTNYPAQHYALVLWDHGSGWPGTAYDDSAGGDGLTVPEMARALDRLGAVTGVQSLDVIAFDACLMAQIEVFQALAPYGRVGVASAEIMPGSGFDYVAILQALRDSPATDGAALARTMVDSYMYFYQNVDTSNPAFTLVAVDLSRVGEVTEALGEVAAAVQTNPEAVLSQIGDARNNALMYTDYYLVSEEVETIASVDLGDLMSRLAHGTNVSGVASAAQSVVDGIKQFVLYERHSEAWTGVTGLGVYFPRTLESFERHGAEYVSEAGEDARWLGFLRSYYGTADSVIVEAPQLFITSLYPETLSIHSPTTISIDLTGRDIAHVVFVLNYQMADGSYVTLDRDTIVTWEDVDGELVTVNSWDDGLNSFTFPWNGETPYVSDGRTRTYALLVPAGEALEIAVGQGRFAQAGTEDWTEATLVFDLDTRQVTAVYGIAKAEGNSPYQLKPQPGDRFQLYWVFLNEDGTTTTQPGETLIFGDVPFSFDYAPAPSGMFRMGFVVEDIAGNVDYQWVELQVNNEGLDAALRGYTDMDFGFTFLYPDAWYEPTWSSADEVLYGGAEEADISFTIYPLEGAYTPLEAAAALQGQWSVDLQVTGKRQVMVGDVPVLVVEYHYQGQEGPRRGMYAAFYQPLVDLGFGFDVDAAAEDLAAASVGIETVLASLTLFDPEAVRGAGAWTTDVNQSLAYALPVRSEWMPPETREDWVVYEPEGGDGNTFVALRADLSEGQSDQDAAEEWVTDLYEFEGYVNVQISNRREYYIGNERWYAVDFDYIWEDDNTPITGAFFVTNRGDFSYVYWIEAPSSEYKTAYNDTFSVMIDGFEFLSGVQPIIPSGPAAASSLSELYTAAGDGYRPSELTPTATFSADDDINIVFTTTAAAEVSVVFVLPDGEQVEVEGGQFEAGVSDILGLDWESYGQPWPPGQWSAEVYVGGVLETTLPFQVGG